MVLSHLTVFLVVNLGVHSQSCSKSEVKSEIAFLDEVYRGAENFSESSPPHQLEYLDSLLELALFADSTNLVVHPVFDQMIVMQARVHFSREELEHFDGRTLIQDLIDRNLLFRLPFKPKVRKIEVFQTETWAMVGRASKKKQTRIPFHEIGADCSADLGMYHQFLSDELKREFGTDASDIQDELIQFIEQINNEPATEKIWVPISPRINPHRAYQSMIERFDNDFPGRGLDVFNDTLKDRPMAYALILLAEANRYFSTKDASSITLIRKCGNWLFENADLDEDSVPGYGLADAWDAFNDSTINHAHTEYTVTTALACRALMAWQDVEAQTDSYIIVQELIRQCLSPYLEDSLNSIAGIPAYSTASSDSNYDVYNSALLVANEMISFGHRYPDDSLSDLFLKKGFEVRDSVISWGMRCDNGVRYWNYSKQNNRANDLVHALYMIEGLRRNYEPGLPDSAWHNYVDHIFDFVVDGTWYDHSVERYQKDSHLARLWSMGSLLGTLSKEGKDEIIEHQLLEQLLAYQIEPGKYRIRPNDDRSFIRMEAHLLFGLSEYLFR